jgi:hypothetical protein
MLGMIRQGKLAQTRELAFRWADDHDPRISADRNELASWGRILTRVHGRRARQRARPGTRHATAGPDGRRRDQP